MARGGGGSYRNEMTEKAQMTFFIKLVINSYSLWS